MRECYVRELPLELKVGQMIMAGFRGAFPPPHILRGLGEGAMGSVLLFGDGSLTAQQLRHLATNLQEAALRGAAGLPLLIAADEEGGRVSRLSPPLTTFPCPRLIGATGHPGLAAELGGAMAKELRAVGVNMNLAPVMDILSNSENPVIGDRAFGCDAALVSEFGRAFIRGLQENGVMATAKHFPGHGDTSFDSHHTLGKVEQREDALWVREIEPFRVAIGEGVGAIMTAHVIYPGFDADLPATLCEKIVTGILRERLGYRGIIITDDLEMRAISGNYAVGAAAVAAVSAGADIVMVSKEECLQREAYSALLKAAYEGRISMDKIDLSVSRIMRSKGKYARPDYNIDIEVVQCQEHIALARKIERRGRQG